MTEPGFERWMGKFEQMLADMAERGKERQISNEAAAAEVRRLLEATNKQRADEFDRLSIELRTVKHDGRNTEQKIVAFEERAMAQRAATDVAIKALREDLEEIKGPVKQLMEMRQRWGGIVMVGAGFVSIVGLLFSTIGRWVFELFTTKHGGAP